MELYNKNAIQISRLTTVNYSTSFSLGVRILKKEMRDAIFSIYGFVRFADEIVDDLYGYPRKELLDDFKGQTYDAIEKRVSTNPILHSFQLAVHKYHIPLEYVDAFLHSMEMDLYQSVHDEESFQTYIYGSAEVVGLMCLKVFHPEDEKAFQELIHPARKLGESFQKINFLRDIKADYKERGRLYFPGIDFQNFTNEQKRMIEENIHNDFKEAYLGIKKLKKRAQLGVYLSYKYYTRLLKKIKRTDASQIIQRRYRISNASKIMLLFTSSLRYKMNLL